MLPKGANREEVLELLNEEGGRAQGAASRVSRASGVPEADVYGASTFYSLFRAPTALRVCEGLSCQVAGCEELKADLAARGRQITYSSCLGRCDVAPAVWDPQGEEAVPDCCHTPSSPDLAIDLSGPDDDSYDALAAALERGGEWVCDQLETAALTGRGGAGFPAHVKWRGVRDQDEAERYVVLNADEGEPGTFKDREVMLRRPHLVVEGLAIAAAALEAQEIWIYVRGEFGAPRVALERALAEARADGSLAGLKVGGAPVTWHFVDGHGAYICGEETALLESLEGKRGMPRMKPPYPVQVGFRGKPTLIQNVETIACLPAILTRGGEWFRDLGRTEAGTKLYCLSGHVVHPGVYEAPMGIPLSELLEMAGGVDGTLKAFSPGGASSGFLPAERADVPLDFAALKEAGSMLGSAGIVVLNREADMVGAVLSQLVFFEEESCGQCSPCRIGTRLLRRALEEFRETGDPAALEPVDEVSWGMGEASICGLGQAAPLCLTSALEYFPEEFGRAPATKAGEDFDTADEPWSEGRETQA